MHKDKIYFLCFWKEEINLIFLKKNLKKIFGENRVFLILGLYLTV
jgi:hypothetical protein